MQSNLVVSFDEVRFVSGMHGAWSYAFQTPGYKLHWSCEADSRVGAHSSKLWPYTENWAKRRRWVLFHKSTV